MNILLPEFDFAKDQQPPAAGDNVDLANVALPAPRQNAKAANPVP